MQMNEKKYFVLMKGGKDTTQVFHSKQPRGAALKAASRGETDISLRERGTNRVHVFKGEKNMVSKPASAPDWLPDKINKANVKKIRIDRM
ncbi:MAG: hypothetical protein ACI9EM_000050 [Candidatus Thalassarchaeaceae archaeon]|jgi:hypothetical protein|tara:strand:- start:317 stop:586 length:270 start_codon:yes stop_codon:yes gene_type:complete